MKLLILFVTIIYVFGPSSWTRALHVTKVKDGVSGSGITTRYWDCCKPSCSWVENVDEKNAVASCAADGTTVVNTSTKSSCDGGDAFMCTNQQPTVVNSTFAYGFVAASFSGGVDNNMCCACVLLTFGDALQGKQMLVQVTNTGGDLGSNQFDIAIPGGGVGIFTLGCSSQWGCPTSGWGDQYGGVSSSAECETLPTALQDGCKFRFDFMGGVSNPSVTFEQVTCPDELTSLTSCIV